MIDIFMLVMMIVLGVVLLIISLYLLAHYCHPDDNGFGSGLICKIATILGLFIAWAQVLLLPGDVANTRGAGGGIRMDIIWEVIYITIGVFVFFIIPIGTAFYEADPEWSCCEKVSNAFCFFICQTIVIIALFGVGFAFGSKAEVPIKTINCSLANFSKSDVPIPAVAECSENDGSLELTVGFPIFAIGLLSFLSYFLFVLFGGIGIFALPLDMIYSFTSRPIKLDESKIDELKKEIVGTAADLKVLALSVKKMEKEGIHKKSFLSGDKRKYNQTLKELKVGVSVIDDQYQLINVQKGMDGSGVIGYYCNMIFGCLGFLVTLIWVIHILLYVVIRINNKPVHTALNVGLVFLNEHNVAFLATGIFSLMCLYLLLATIKGNFKFGIRFVLMGSIHPMKKNETYMNSIGFNTSGAMIASVSVNQFCVKAFNEYAAATDIDIIFSTQIKYLKFFVFFFRYNIFEYAGCVIMFLSFIYLICRKSDTDTMKELLYKKQDEKKSNEGGKKDKLIELPNISSGSLGMQMAVAKALV